MQSQQVIKEVRSQKEAEREKGNAYKCQTCACLQQTFHTFLDHVSLPIIASTVTANLYGSKIGPIIASDVPI